MPKISVAETFKKFDLNRDGAIDGSEVDAHFKEVGIDGGMVGTKAREQFFEKFDADHDGQVRFAEFCQNGSALMPPGVTDGSGRLSEQKADEVFDQIAGRGKEQASSRQIEKYIKGSLPFAVRMAVGGQLASAGAQSILKVLDATGDGRVNRADMKALVADVNQELAKLAH